MVNSNKNSNFKHIEDSIQHINIVFLLLTWNRYLNAWAINPFYFSVAFHMEASHLIDIAFENNWHLYEKHHWTEMG